MADTPETTPAPDDELVRRARSVRTAFDVLWPAVGPVCGFVLTLVGAYQRSPELITAGTGLLSGGSLVAVLKNAVGKKG